MPVAVGSPQPYSPTSRRGAALEPTKLSWLLGLVSLEKPQVPRTRSSPSSDSSELQIQIPRFASLETTHWMDEKEFTSVELQLRELHRAQEVEEAHGFSRSVLAKAISRERNVSQQSHFSNDLFISHCWRGGGKSQEIKRRIIAELSKDEVGRYSPPLLSWGLKAKALPESRCRCVRFCPGEHATRLQPGGAKGGNAPLLTDASDGGVRKRTRSGVLTE